MHNTSRFYIACLMAFFCMATTTACNNQATTTANSLAQTTDKPMLAKDISATKQMGNDPITERGVLTELEDGGYPFATLTIEFPERNFKEHFTINLEEVKSVNMATLNGWLGKHISFEYNSEVENALIDLKSNGKSVFPKGNRPPIAGAKAITGILSNAAEATQGDIPSELYIKTEEEITEKFPFFITEDIVKLNGKTVVGYYQQRTKNTIVSMKLIE
jgi:hypothetical protein